MMSKMVEKNERHFDAQFVSEYYQLRKAVTCSICLEVFKHPVCLPCSHAYCHGCITSAMETKEACPMCQKKITKKSLVVISCLEQALEHFDKLLTSLDPDKDRSILTPSVSFPPLPATYIAEELPMETQFCHDPLEEISHQMNHETLPYFTCSETLPVQLPLLTTEAEEETEAETEAEIVLPKTPAAKETVPRKEPFAVGAFVTVLPRTWIGINKLGGVARVEGHEDVDNIYYYKVKYVLDGNKEQEIPQQFVEKFEELERKGRKKRTRHTLHEIEEEGGEEENEEDMFLHAPAPSKSADSSATKTRKTKDTSPSSHSNSNINAVSSSSSASNKKLLASNKKEKSKLLSGTSATLFSPVKEPKTKTKQGKTHEEEEDNASQVTTLSTPEHPPTATTTTTSTAAAVNNAIVLLTTCMDHTVSATTFTDNKLARFSSTLSAGTTGNTSTSITIETRFTPAITHVIVSTDRQGMVKQRTMKYMLGIAHGLWIVSFQWILDCLKAKCLLDERKYEIVYNSKAEVDSVPRLARESITLYKQPRLLHAYHVFVYGFFPLPGPPKSDVNELLTACGATVYTKMEEFLSIIKNIKSGQIVILCAHATPSSSSSSSAAVKEHDSEEHKAVATTKEIRDFEKKIQAYFPAENIFETAKVTTVNTLWLMDSVTNFTIQPYGKYKIV